MHFLNPMLREFSQLLYIIKRNQISLVQVSILSMKESNVLLWSGHQKKDKVLSSLETLVLNDIRKFCGIQ